tara:strand:- start:304 stop:519 length:216 start_codon:yes stop_codon:yes gene_type:complete
MVDKKDPQEFLKSEIKLSKLKEQHRKIEIMLSDIRNPILDPLILRRLKKEKLILKDKIHRITNQLTPNIIA